MRYTYDDEADALYLRLDEDAPVARSVVVDEARVVDVDVHGRPVGIEVIAASQGVSLHDLIETFGLEPFRDHLAAIEGQRFAPVVRG